METVSSTFIHHISHSEEKTYIRIPFSVEKDVETLTISYSYIRHRSHETQSGITVQNEVNIIDLALEDGDFYLIGASGSQRQTITIHENYATPGYRPTTLTQGTWYLVLGAYLIEEKGCDVTVSIHMTQKESVLLKGDTHCHTEHSDGWYSTEEIIERARQDRLDYIFITDHNCMCSNDLLFSYPDLTVLPGVEITYYGGHYNLFGVKRPVKTYTANTREDVLAIMREGVQSGALCSINHPVDPGCGWKFGIGKDVPIDMVEIWNGPYTKWTRGSIDLWESELKKGRIWPAIGGSDCHKAELFRNFATPCTFLYSRGRSGSDIMDAMKQGHAFIGMNPDAPILHMQLGDSYMGDVYTGCDSMLTIRVENLHQEDELLLIDQSGIIGTWKPGRCQKFVVKAQVENSLYLRLEVLRSLQGLGKTLASISNPIYIRR